MYNYFTLAVGRSRGSRKALNRHFLNNFLQNIDRVGRSGLVLLIIYRLMARPTKHEQHYRYVGRPSKMTPEVVGKLEEAFSIGASVPEACLYADINESTYYDWLKKNEEFSKRMEQLQEKPILLARQTVATAIKNGDATLALKYLERKKRAEFALRTEVENSGDITINIIDGDKP